MIYKFLRFVMTLMKAFSDHEHKVECACEGFTGVDSLRLQFHAIRSQFWCCNKFECICDFLTVAWSTTQSLSSSRWHDSTGWRISRVWWRCTRRTRSFGILYTWWLLVGRSIRSGPRTGRKWRRLRRCTRSSTSTSSTTTSGGSARKPTACAMGSFTGASPTPVARLCSPRSTRDLGWRLSRQWRAGFPRSRPPTAGLQRLSKTGCLGITSTLTTRMKLAT